MLSVMTIALWKRQCLFAALRHQREHQEHLVPREPFDQGSVLRVQFQQLVVCGHLKVVKSETRRHRAAHQCIGGRGAHCRAKQASRRDHQGGAITTGVVQLPSGLGGASKHVQIDEGRLP